MTLQEVHEFGIEIIENYSKEEGFEVVAVSNFLHENPQIAYLSSRSFNPQNL
jgi:hypothetical protein